MDSEQRARARQKKRKAKRLARLAKASKRVRPAATSDEERFVQKLEQTIDHPAPHPVGLLWHYTRPAAFPAIIGSGVMRATDYESAEDETDVVYAHEIVEATARDLRERTRDRAFDVFLANFERLKITTDNDVFRICFCAAQEDIGMWDRYAERGRGYAFGFDLREAMPKSIPFRSVGFGLWPIQYDRVLQVNEVRNDFEMIGSLANEFRQNNAIAAREMLRRAATYCMYFKDPRYASEREWRIGCVRTKGSTGMRVFSSDDEAKPTRYVRFEAAGGGLFPLREVLLGPRAAMSVVQVQRLLGEHGYGTRRPMPLVRESTMRLR